MFELIDVVAHTHGKQPQEVSKVYASAEIRIRKNPHHCILHRYLHFNRNQIQVIDLLPKVDYATHIGCCGSLLGGIEETTGFLTNPCFLMKQRPILAERRTIIIIISGFEGKRIL